MDANAAPAVAMDERALPRAAALRLSIAQLLLWMAGTALVVAYFPTGWLAGPRGIGDRQLFYLRAAQRRTLERLSVAAVAPCYGAALAGLAVAAARLLARQPGFPSLPGHWPLVNLGLWVLIVGSIVNVAPDRDLSPYNLHVVRQNLGVPLVILLAAAITVAIQAVLAVREPRRWRWALRCHLAAMAVPILALVIVPLDHAGPRRVALAIIIWSWYLAALAGVLVGLWDFIRRERFDLFHWVGVVSLLGILAHPPLTWLIADVAF